MIKKSKKLPCSWEGNATQVIGSASHKQPLAYSYVPWVHLQNFKHSSLLIQKVNGKIEHSFSNELTKASHMNLPERTMFTSRSKILILRNFVNCFKTISLLLYYFTHIQHSFRVYRHIMTCFMSTSIELNMTLIWLLTSVSFLTLLEID